MFKNLQISLYDFFGYLLPGCIVLLAIAIPFWIIFVPNLALNINNISTELWIIILVMAYFFGHFAQSSANYINKLFPPMEKEVIETDASNRFKKIVKKAKEKSNQIYTFGDDALTAKELYDICDITITQFGRNQEREIYRYREGFYRGLAVSLFALTLSTVAAIIFPIKSITINGAAMNIGQGMLLFFAIISFVGAILSYLRFRRFRRYHIKLVIVSYPALFDENLGKAGNEE